VQGTDGSFYGTTFAGGVSSIGTIFNESMGLAPFVKTNPTSAQWEKTVRILGNNLTGTTSVTFTARRQRSSWCRAPKSQPASLQARTTGTVQVTTPSGTLNSNISSGSACERRLLSEKC